MFAPLRHRPAVLSGDLQAGVRHRRHQLYRVLTGTGLLRGMRRLAHTDLPATRALTRKRLNWAPGCRAILGRWALTHSMILF